MKGNNWKRYGAVIAFLAVAALALGGCSSGSDGTAGPAGAAGATGPAGPAGPIVTDIATLSAEQLKAATFTGDITSVSIASPAVVNFWIKDAAGRGVTGLGAASTTATDLNFLRFAIAKLIPGTNGSPDQWVSYMVTETSRPTSERVKANLVDKGNGYYTYTFAKDLATVPGVTYEPTRTHRLVIQFSGTVPGTTNAIANPLNIVKDFVPAGGALPLSREITTTAACNSCHTAIGVTTPHGGRVDTRYCVVCHTDQRKIGRTNSASVANVFTGTQYIADGVVLGDVVPMIHKIHMGHRQVASPSAPGAAPRKAGKADKPGLVKTGYNYAGVLFNEIGYPQQKSNCRTCHTASAAAPQGDNWKNRPSRQACGACHDGIDWATGLGTAVNDTTAAQTGHIGGKQLNDALCYICHDAVSIASSYHVTKNATTNNPAVPTGAANFTYEIGSVTVNASNQAVVKFRILKDGTPITLNAYAAGATMLTGFSPTDTVSIGSPSLALGYAQPQDGIASPADFNNLARPIAQPQNASLVNLWKGSAGSLSARDADGYYTATITSPTFPAGAKMRTILLQGYFIQTNLAAYPYVSGDDSTGLARHAVAAVKTATGDTARRSVVDDEKCGKCHEWLEGHDGSRVKTIAACVFCHNPNLSSSSRRATAAQLDGATDPGEGTAARITFNLGAIGSFTNTTSLQIPEQPQNWKDMVHALHAKAKRTNAFKFARQRGSAHYGWDYTEVTYPALLKNCEACHNPGTYNSVPTGALPSTTVSTSGAAGTVTVSATGIVGGAGAETTCDAVVTTRNITPNNRATDLVTSPFAAACVACHDTDTAKAHMTANGGQLNKARSLVAAAAAEQCAVCHGAGRSSDAAVKHK